ncbi:hypothetical protein [Pseudosulfitobacter pseudonitzschiae]|uniref:hypothetical protein n=1 Tax=Pseudosulfitobacter pseudonitzschiae TaxID=1402135 RepID=UPI003B79864A
METTINALTERVKIPVEIIEDGVYAGEQAVGMKPGAEVVFLLGNGQLISELGTFKR